MRVLITALAPSHLLCMVPLAWAARAAGHDVLVAGRVEVCAVARQAGLHTADVAVLPVESLRPRGARPFPAHGWRHPWELRVDQVLDGCLAAALSFRPDLVVCDPIEFAGLVVAGLLGVPAVVQRWGGPGTGGAGVLERAREVLGDFCADLGLGAPGLPDPVLTLDPCPPSLRFEEAEPGRPMRFVPYNGSHPVPDWARRAPRRPRVCVTLGLHGSTVAAQDGDPAQAEELTARLEAAVGALARRPDVDVVLTAPAALHRRLTGLPGWFRVVERAPLDAVLPGCSLVVHHGGTGTAMTAAVHGVPQLVLPTDHPAWAACADGLVRRRVARRPEADDRKNPDALARELDILLGPNPHRDHARSLAGEIADQPSPARMVPVLEAMG
ncbi:hypothetical protein ACM01_01465 [Streptomyces viridochromogenes]|uniref:Uncharacterized protein n=1 Tax=Streptomyces viridochromogenes TaxID=1938 RepID=A0A0J7ZMY8_STRVR|nr:nucleotide disphospho-sugar-binding domain-containing protein [Streptomyces viridochromogenes]KMS77324.1 hypothetical protein ACM01_01465 [Streptomyces viridochromogenes]KOG19047.1 hypothetical protein ADK36_20595 [Streptomyces viridochromogenes]KOG19286.1 hypothetical protein ADK35_20455 [Streptomyces viridochromogenes]